jgi:hypothetical protein
MEDWEEIRQRIGMEDGEEWGEVRQRIGIEDWEEIRQRIGMEDWRKSVRECSREKGWKREERRGGSTAANRYGRFEEDRERIQ